MIEDVEIEIFKSLESIQKDIGNISNNIFKLKREAREQGKKDRDKEILEYVEKVRFIADSIPKEPVVLVCWLKELIKK